MRERHTLDRLPVADEEDRLVAAPHLPPDTVAIPVHGGPVTSEGPPERRNDIVGHAPSAWADRTRVRAERPWRDDH